MDQFTNNGVNSNMMFAQLLRDKFGNDRNAAIRYVREQTGMGLQEAIRYVEMIYAVGSQASNYSGTDNPGYGNQNINSTPMPSNNPMPAFSQPAMQNQNPYPNGGVNQATPMNPGVNGSANFNPQLIPGPAPTNYGYNNNVNMVNTQNNKKNGKMKDSMLSIWAAVFALFTCSYWLGILLAIIDLAVGLPMKDGKRHLGSYFALVCGFIVMCMTISNATKNNNDASRSYANTSSQNNSYSVINTSATNTNKTQTTEVVVQETPSPFKTISTGTYIIGEDLEPGTYSFHAKSGKGDFLIYNNYDEFAADDYGYDARLRYNVKANKASVGLLNEDVYTEHIANIRLVEGQCINVDSGLELEYSESLSDFGSNGILSPGTYIVGETIEAKNICFHVIRGMGELLVYNSYEDMLADLYGYDANIRLNIRAADGDVGLLNPAIYTEYVANLNLKEGQVIQIEKGAYLATGESMSSFGIEGKLYPGVYVIGENLDAGKYSFDAIQGLGELRVYKNYDIFWKDLYGYDANERYDMKAPDADPGLYSEDHFAQSANNVRLKDGNVLFIESGLTLNYNAN